ncbi:MAG: hypothetical protein FWG12_05330 [Holophagaceae bacterium]|nr:hypothetical protein [Holophagaceae bacterium]
MFAHLIHCLTILVAFNILQEDRAVVIPIEQNEINVEIHAKGYPPTFSHGLDMKLKFIAADAQKMDEAGRIWPIKEDYLAELVSTNKFSWEISYANNGTSRITGTGQSVTFKFSKPFPVFDNAVYFIDLDAELETTLEAGGSGMFRNASGGNSRVSSLAGYGSLFVPETPYVFVIINYNGPGNSSVSMARSILSDYHLVTKDKLQDVLSGKLSRYKGVELSRAHIATK